MEPRLFCGLDLPENVWILRGGDQNRSTKQVIESFHEIFLEKDLHTCLSMASASSN